MIKNVIICAKRTGTTPTRKFLDTLLILGCLALMNSSRPNVIETLTDIEPEKKQIIDTPVSHEGSISVVSFSSFSDYETFKLSTIWKKSKQAEY